jgi:hypothetical protein
MQVEPKMDAYIWTAPILLKSPDCVAVAWDDETIVLVEVVINIRL